MAKKPTKIKKYRKPLNLNIGMMIFSIVFVYVLICVVLYFRTNHIVRYEVKEGSLAINNVYRGLIFRSEEVVKTNTAGYVNYYAYEGERVAVGDLVYTVDETGRLNEYFENGDFGTATLTDKELSDFRNEISSFLHGFEETNFSGIYDFKRSLNNSVMKLANVNMLKGVAEVQGNGTNSSVIDYCRAPLTGIVAYWTDGYEGLTPEDVTKDLFDEKKYTREDVLGNRLMAGGDAAYKLSTSENWYVVVPIEKERGEMLEKEGYVKVRFLKNRYESWGEAKMLTGSDENHYLSLKFTNSMISFVSDRFLDIELIVHDETGLKIPISSIVEKEFYLIPKDFILDEGENGSSSVIRQCYLEDGTISSEVVNIDIYSYDEENNECYLDASRLNAGDVLYKVDSQETFVVSRRATLIGVYNMNKGYADFKQINILYQNDEYAIVKANTKYGLNVYDYIVLRADSVSDDQFIIEKGK